MISWLIRKQNRTRPAIVIGQTITLPPRYLDDTGLPGGNRLVPDEYSEALEGGAVRVFAVSKSEPRSGTGRAEEGSRP
jgi:hypothetical protein